MRALFSDLAGQAGCRRRCVEPVAHAERDDVDMALGGADIVERPIGRMRNQAWIASDNIDGARLGKEMRVRCIESELVVDAIARADGRPGSVVS